MGWTRNLDFDPWDCILSIITHWWLRIKRPLPPKNSSFANKNSYCIGPHYGQQWPRLSEKHQSGVETSVTGIYLSNNNELPGQQNKMDYNFESNLLIKKRMIWNRGEYNQFITSFFYCAGKFLKINSNNKKKPHGCPNMVRYGRNWNKTHFRLLIIARTSRSKWTSNKILSDAETDQIKLR